MASGQNWNSLGGLTLHVGSSSFAVADANTANNKLGKFWLNSGVTLTVGTSVQVSLVEPPPTPAYQAPCDAGTGNIRNALNPTGLNLFPGDGVLTAAWVNPATDKSVVDPFIRWKKDGTDVWLNSGGATGNRAVGRLGQGGQTYDITGLENLATYNVEVKVRAYNTDPHNTHECIHSQWVRWNEAPRAPTSMTPPTSVTVTSSGPLREGGPTVNVYFTLDRPAPAGMLTTLGHDDRHAWFKHRGPVFAAGATTAVMRISVPQDTDDNNCRTLGFRVWFGWGGTGYDNVLEKDVSFSVVDDDGTADTCSGLLGSPDPTVLAMSIGSVQGNRDWNSVTVRFLPTLDKPAVGTTFVTVAHTVSPTADPTHFKVHGTRLLIHDGDTSPRYRNSRGEWADFALTVSILGDADDSDVITFTATTDGPGLTTRYVLNVGDFRRRAGLQNDDPNADLQGPGVEVSATELDVAVGGTVGYTVKLQSPPIDDVLISPTVADAGKASVSPSQLYFTAETWNVAQAVTVRGLAAGATAVRHSVQSADPDYVIAPDVTVTVGSTNTNQESREDSRLTNPHAALIAKVRGWRDDPRYSANKAHTDRWDRVLLALGATVPDASLTPMSAAEAQTYADRGWTRWVEVAAALKQIENGGTQTPVAQTPVPVVSIAAGAAVTEGAPAGFTLTAAPAPAADLGVSVTVSQSGDYAASGAAGSRTVTIPAGQTSASFAVATVDDAADEPDGAVVAALGSGTGYTLGDAARATVAVADNDAADNLPAIETKRGIAREGSDEAVVFTVRLSRASTDSVFVDYETADGSGRWAGTAPARAGADYTAVEGTLIFGPGQTVHTLSVPLIDDAIDEGTEYFLLRFSNPEGATLAASDREVQGLIRNSDPLQAMWLSRFGRMVASDAVEAVTARFETPRAAGSHLTVLGQRLSLDGSGDSRALTDVLTGFAQAFGAPTAPTANDDDPFLRHGLSNSWNETGTAVAGARRVTERELLLGTSFRAVLPAGAGSQFTSWGQGASVSQFSAAVPGLGLTGEAATGSLGFDYERGRLLTGFAMTHSVGDGTARDAGWRYAMGSTATTVLPFARLALTDRVSAWAMAGTGTGQLTLDLDGPVSQHYRTDLAMTLAATGVRGELVKPAEPGGLALALKADAFWVRTESDRVASSEFGSLMGARGESSRVRAVLDGSRTFALAGGATLSPSVELGLRQDGGDAETGTGLEFGAGLGYADPSRGLDVAFRVHGLAAHAEDRYSEWGVSGQLRLVPGGSGRGLSASLMPSWGADPGGSERLWAQPAAAGLAANGDAPMSSRLNAEVGYGMALFGDRFTGTPNVGLGLSDTAREMRLGWRLTSAVPNDPGFEVNLDATRREAANGNEPAEHGVMLRSAIRW